MGALFVSNSGKIEGRNIILDDITKVTRRDVAGVQQFSQADSGVGIGADLRDSDTVCGALHAVAADTPALAAFKKTFCDLKRTLPLLSA